MLKLPPCCNLETAVATESVVVVDVVVVLLPLLSWRLMASEVPPELPPELPPDVVPVDLSLIHI